MSGILALCYFDGKSIDEHLFRKMLASQKLRGPDGMQYCTKDSVALGHAKLNNSTESLDENQPSHLDNQLWLTADVRLDGRKELIEKLSQAGKAFSPDTSDEQLLLWSYKIWGEHCLEYLIGDFAFIVWDRHERQLFCATDQFGVTPLYYAELPEGICISNSINAIRCHPSVGTELDQLAIADYLLFRANTNANGTTYQQIKHLPASHSLSIKNNQIQIRQYYRFKPRSKIYRNSSKAYIEEFRYLLKLAVKDRMRSNVIATHLSGGMDSASVAALAEECLTENGSRQTLKAYTRGSGDSDAEVPFAKAITKQLGISHKIYAKDTPELEVESIDNALFPPEPSFMCRDITRFQLLNDIQAQGRVVFSGYGGDALLRGVPIGAQDYSSPQQIFSRLKECWMHYQIFGRRPNMGLSLPFKKTGKKDRVNAQLPNWIHPDFARKHELLGHYTEISNQRADKANHQSFMLSEPLWRRIFCWNDPGFTHIPVKMLNPFFDVRLLEYATSLPPFPWLQDKHVLRQSMANHLPNSVTDRPKTILPAKPLGKAIERQGLPGHYQKLLAESQISAFIDSQRLQGDLNSSVNCDRSTYSGIMRAVTLSHWLKYRENTFNSFCEELEDGNIRKITI